LYISEVYGIEKCGADFYYVCYVLLQQANLSFTWTNQVILDGKALRYHATAKK